MLSLYQLPEKQGANFLDYYFIATFVVAVLQPLQKTTKD
jgi:hypothetical protein